MSHIPRVIHSLQELHDARRDLAQAGKRVGVVPTMGALHAGHLSLVAASCAACDATLVTLFVNPTQFGPHEDFEKYPRTLDADLQALSPYPVDLVFAPTAAEMYPAGFETNVQVGGVTELLEGARRPGHFDGVATVVLKLLNLTRPDVAYFGQKDYQQTLVVRRMVADLNLPVEVCICPIVREPDGLAMSSRNVYLTEVQRQLALVLSQSLQHCQAMVSAGERSAAQLIATAESRFANTPDVELEYFTLVNPETLLPVETLDQPAIALTAAQVGQTRLIDNLRISD